MSINDPFGKLCHLLNRLLRRFRRWIDFRLNVDAQLQRWTCRAAPVGVNIREWGEGDIDHLKGNLSSGTAFWCAQCQARKISKQGENICNDGDIIFFDCFDFCGFCDFCDFLWYHHLLWFLWRFSLFSRRQFHGRMISLKHRITLEIVLIYISKTVTTYILHIYFKQ